MSKILLKRTTRAVEGQPALPEANNIDAGELAINYLANKEVIAAKNTNNQIVCFSSDNKLQSEGKLLPQVSSSDNGKVLMVVEGQWAAVTPLTVFTGEGTPSSNLGSNGDVFIQVS